MIRILISILVLFLIAAGGYAGWRYFETGTIPEMQAIFDDTESENVDIDDPYGDYDPNQGAPPNFVELRPFYIPVFKGNRVIQHAELILFVQAMDDATLPILRRRAPELQAVYLAELTSFINLMIEETGEIDRYYVKRRLLYIGQKLLGKGVLHGIYFRHFFVRRVS